MTLVSVRQCTGCLMMKQFFPPFVFFTCVKKSHQMKICSNLQCIIITLLHIWQPDRCNVWSCVCCVVVRLRRVMNTSSSSACRCWSGSPTTIRRLERLWRSWRIKVRRGRSSSRVSEESEVRGCWIWICSSMKSCWYRIVLLFISYQNMSLY